jgi:hemerythrin-like domain-containing protein
LKDDTFARPLTRRVSALPAQPAAATEDLRSLLHDDHQHIVTLARDLADAETAAARRALYAELRTRLDAHARAEEAVVYDALLRRGGRDAGARDLGNEGLVEHELVDQLLDRLSHTDLAGSDTWRAQARVLQRLIARHIDEEEGACFDALDDHFSPSQRRAMAQAFARLRADARRVEVPISD